MAELRKYGVETKIVFPLFVAGENNFILNATHASGDTLISKDEGTEVNTTNGFVDEGRFYSLTLTATEMQASRIAITIIDQGTKAYDDQMIVIETYGNASAQHEFDLDTASTPQTGDAYAKALDIEADTQDLQTQIGTDGAGLTALPWNAAWDAEVQSEVTDALNAYDPPTNAELNARTLAAADYATATAVSGLNDISAADVWSHGTRILTAGTNIVLAKGTGVTGFNDLTAAQVNAEVDTALSDVGLTTTITGRIDAAISTRLATAGYSAPDNSTITANKAILDKLDTAMELDGSVYRFTTNALEQAPSGGGGGLDAAGVRAAIGLASANLDTQLSGLDTQILTRLAAASYTAPDNAGIGNILTDTGTTLPAQIAALSIPTASQNATAVRSELTTELGRIDAAISTRLAAASYTAPDNAGISSISTLVQDIPTNAELSAALTTLALESSVQAITVPTASEIADAVHDEAVDGSLTFRQSTRLQNSAMFAKLSGATTSTIVIRDVADTKARITATVDGDGNRTTVTVDGT